MNSFKKIFDYLKSNNEIEMEELFCIITSGLDYKLGNQETKETVLLFFEKTKKENSCPEVFPLIEETKWLGLYEWRYLGIYKNKIIAFSEDGEFSPFCRSIQNIPLEILSYNSFLIKHTKDVSQNMYYLNDLVSLKNDYYINIFMNYLNFTRNNDITLDPEYFNEDGELKMFYHPFEIEYDYAEFGIEYLKGKEFLN